MLELALKVALRSTHPFAFHVALVFRNGNMLAAEANAGWRHAEARALSKVSPEKRSRLTLYSLRFNALGDLRQAKPCANCEVILRNYGVKTVHYSNAAGQILKMKL